MRDTDADWRAIAESEPYFGVLTQEQFRIANLTPGALDEFYVSGKADVDGIVGELRRRWPEFGPRSAIDFGCGVGRLTAAMLDHAPEVVGVDVSAVMLRLAQQRCEALNTPGRTARFTDAIPAAADWVMSHIVFQHIPPARGLLLLDELLSALPVGGFASLQFALHRQPRHMANLDAGLVRFDGEQARVLTPAAEAAPGMQMFDYDAGAIIARYFAAGLVDPVLLHTDHGGYIGAWFLGRKHH